MVTYLGPDSAPLSWQFVVTFNQSSLTAVASPGGALQNAVTVSANLAGTAAGLSWAATPGRSSGTTPAARRAS